MPFAPRSASRSAVASPIPLLAPVIATILPSIPDMRLSFSRGWPFTSVAKDPQFLATLGALQFNKSAVEGVLVFGALPTRRILRVLVGFGIGHVWNLKRINRLCVQSREQLKAPWKFRPSKNQFGSACAAFPKTNPTAMAPTRKPWMRSMVKLTNMMPKAIGEKSGRKRR
jgi:hypothetical protein